MRELELFFFIQLDFHPPSTKMQEREEALRRMYNFTSISRVRLLMLVLVVLTETHLFILAFLRTHQLSKSTSALIKELNKQPWKGAEGTGLTLNGEEADKESQSLNGLELISLVRAKLELGKE